MAKTTARPRSLLAERITEDIVNYLRHGPASRAMIVRDIVGSNESIYATVDELELAGTIIRRGKMLELRKEEGRK